MDSINEEGIIRLPEETESPGKPFCRHSSCVTIEEIDDLIPSKEREELKGVLDLPSLPLVEEESNILCPVLIEEYEDSDSSCDNNSLVFRNTVVIQDVTDLISLESTEGNTEDSNPICEHIIEEVDNNGNQSSIKEKRLDEQVEDLKSPQRNNVISDLNSCSSNKTEDTYKSSVELSSGHFNGSLVKSSKHFSSESLTSINDGRRKNPKIVKNIPVFPPFKTESNGFSFRDFEKHRSSLGAVTSDTNPNGELRETISAPFDIEMNDICSTLADDVEMKDQSCVNLVEDIEMKDSSGPVEDIEMRDDIKFDDLVNEVEMSDPSNTEIEPVNGNNSLNSQFLGKHEPKDKCWDVYGEKGSFCPQMFEGKTDLIFCTQLLQYDHDQRELSPANMVNEKKNITYSFMDNNEQIPSFLYKEFSLNKSEKAMQNNPCKAKNTQLFQTDKENVDFLNPTLLPINDIVENSSHGISTLYKTIDRGKEIICSQPSEYKKSVSNNNLSTVKDAEELSQKLPEVKPDILTQTKYTAPKLNTLISLFVLFFLVFI